MKKINYELLIFYITAFIGGFFAGYAVIRCGMFASSQTMNMISITLSLFGKDFGEFIVRLVIMILYAGAISLGVIIPRYSKLDVRIVSIAVTACTAIIMTCIPVDIVSTLSMLPIFFAMALQWSSFYGAMGYQASCIFVTNNFRQMVVGGVSYLCTKDRKYITQFLFYAGDIFIFFTGFVICYISIKSMGVRSAAVVLPMLILMLVLIFKDRKAKSAV